MTSGMKLSGPDPDCAKCNGTGQYAYDHNHSTVCYICCPHDQGWWMLKEHYGADNGKWCCLRGCGYTVVEKPEYVLTKSDRLLNI